MYVLLTSDAFMSETQFTGYMVFEVIYGICRLGCTNPMRQVAQATKFCMVSPYICGS